VLEVKRPRDVEEENVEKVEQQEIKQLRDVEEEERVVRKRVVRNPHHPQ
jgi:hypothetical protein